MSLDPEAVRMPFSDLTGAVGVTPLLQRLLAHGFAVLTDTPRNLDAVQAVADSIGYVRQTIFGGLFEFEANENMADSAYTQRNCDLTPMVRIHMMRLVCSCCCVSAMMLKVANPLWLMGHASLPI